MGQSIEKNDNYYTNGMLQSNKEDVPMAIERTDSKESAHSSVSSVTMYSTYQNDPLVRASNSLMDILRAERHQSQKFVSSNPYTQQRFMQSLPSNLYEA